jgi:hypothetical protein
MDGIKAPVMDWTKPDRVGSYKLFKQKVQMYFQAKSVHADRQVSHILLLTGDEGLAMFNSWDLSDDDQKKADVVWTKFDAQIEPTSSFRVEQLNFQHMKQKPEETSNDFVSRLKNQAELCKFGVQKDKRIIGQIIFGTKHADVQKDLLVKEENYTLDEALEACRIYDASVTHQQAFQEIAKGAESKQVDAMQRGRDSNRSARTCTQCGEERHKSSQGCPARGTKCAKSGGENQWAKVCYSRTNSPYKDNSQSW